MLGLGYDAEFVVPRNYFGGKQPWPITFFDSLLELANFLSEDNLEEVDIVTVVTL